MNLIQRLGANLFSQRFYSENYTPDFASFKVGDTSGIKIDFDNLGDVYHRSAHLKTVVNAKAELLSFGKWKVLDIDGNEIEDPILDLLNNPNPLQSSADFKKSISINKSIYGNAFIYKNGVFQGTDMEAIKQLWIMNSNDMEVIPTGKYYRQNKISDIVARYVLDNGVELDNFTPDEIIRLKETGIELLVEHSKVKTLQPQITNILEAYQARKVLISERGAIGYMSVENNSGNLIPMSPKEKEAIEKKNQTNYGIKKGQNRVNWSTQPLKFTPTVFKTKDLMLFEEVEDDYNVIIDAFGYNRNLLSTTKGTTFENVKESLKLVIQTTIIPEGEAIAGAIQASMPLEGKLVLDYSHLPIMQENQREQAEVMKLKTETYANLLATDSILMSDDEFEENILSLLKS
tara:strand:+ start:453 stop:1661 length:1209 start_codon:yes stop_codon:yes gene_type:complete